MDFGATLRGLDNEHSRYGFTRIRGLDAFDAVLQHRRLPLEPHPYGPRLTEWRADKQQGSDWYRAEAKPRVVCSMYDDKVGGAFKC
jgi:hypothetical protein